MINVLHDATSLNFTLTGIGYHVLNLYKYLEAENKSDQFNFSYLFKDRNFLDDEAFQFTNKKKSFYIDNLEHLRIFSKVKKAFRGKRILLNLEDFLYSRKRKHFFQNIDIFHGQDLYYNYVKSKRITISVFDLTTELFPQFHSKSNIIRYKKKHNFAEKYADAIICNSQSTENDLIRLYPGCKGRTHVVYPSTHEIFDLNEKSLSKEILKSIGIKENEYFLTISTLEPRKNLIKVLEIFSNLKSLNKFHKFKLLLVGQHGWNNSEFDKHLRKNKFYSDIIISGYLPLELIPTIYKHSFIFFYLSKYEGFGLPILEAMKSSCLIVASNNSSIPEVIGSNGGILVDLDNLKGLEENIASLGLDEMNTIKEHAFQNSKKFNWNKSASKTMEIYKSVLG